MGVFTKQTVDEELIAEYFERNERKKQDEAWLKRYSPVIKEALENKPKSAIGEYIVTIFVPDNSKFNEDKVISYLKENAPANVFERCIKPVLDEEGLTACIEEGLIDIEQLKNAAWEEIKGTPRLTISKRKDVANA
jgi:hypothetical protein